MRSHWFTGLYSEIPVATLRDGGDLPYAASLQLGGAAMWTVSGVPIPPYPLAIFPFSEIILSGADSKSSFFHYAFSQAGGSTLTGKLPAGTYTGSAGAVGWNYFDSGFNFVFGNAPLQGEIGAGDALADTFSSPVLIHRTPATGTYLANPGESDGVNDDGSGGTVILVKCQVISDLTQLDGVTINGRPAAVDSSGNVSGLTLLQLGTNPVRISAAAKSGDVTNWDRFYTVPIEMRSNGVLGPLVPAGTTPIPTPKNAVKYGSTVTLELDVTSGGKPAGSLGAYAARPALVDVSKLGIDIPLPTVEPDLEDADGDVDFTFLGGGVWTLKLNTRLFGATAAAAAGTYVMTFEDPTGTAYQAILVVKP
jgi:hypothetical protein